MLNIDTLRYNYEKPFLELFEDLSYYDKENNIHYYIRGNYIGYYIKNTKNILLINTLLDILKWIYPDKIETISVLNQLFKRHFHIDVKGFYYFN